MAPSGRFIFGLLATLALAAPAGAQAPRHLVGGITVYRPGQPQIVVCSVQSPYMCSPVKLDRSTRVVSATTGKTVALTRGQFVAVDASTGGGLPVAMMVKVFPDQVVRGVKDFEAGQAGRIETTLKRLPGVKSVSVLKDLQEVYLSFNPRTTSVPKIERQAATRGIHLQLPG